MKQETACERRISDWSSDVCSSDLDVVGVQFYPAGELGAGLLGVDLIIHAIGMRKLPGGAVRGVVLQHIQNKAFLDGLAHGIHMKGLGFKIGRPSSRERVCLYV